MRWRNRDIASGERRVGATSGCGVAARKKIEVCSSHSNTVVVDQKTNGVRCSSSCTLLDENNFSNHKMATRQLKENNRPWPCRLSSVCVCARSEKKIARLAVFKRRRCYPPLLGECFRGYVFSISLTTAASDHACS